MSDDLIERLRKLHSRAGRAAATEIERLRGALVECSAPYDSGPTTVSEGVALLAREFQRRMDIAGSALKENT